MNYQPGWQPGDEDEEYDSDEYDEDGSDFEDDDDD
jgi:hypothetical protein